MKKLFSFFAVALCAANLFAATATKVTDVSTLQAGDQIIIANLACDTAMSITQNPNNRAFALLDLANVGADVAVVTLGGSAGAWTLSTNGGYLYPAQSDKNYLRVQADPYTWSISISGGVASIVGVALNHHLAFNNTVETPIFSAYKASSSIAANVCICKLSGEVPVLKPDTTDATISQFIGKTDKINFMRLRGVVSNIKNTEYGNFTFTDATGALYVYGLLTADEQTKQFASLGVAEGDTLTILAKEYKLFSDNKNGPDDEVVNAIYVSHVSPEEGGEEGGGEEGGGEEEEGDFTYEEEPTAKTTITKNFTNFVVEDYTEDDGVVLLYLSDNEDEDLETAWLVLYLVADEFDAETGIPAGTYPINDSYALNTVVASPGAEIDGDDIYDQPTYLGVNYDAETEWWDSYYLVSGTLTVSVSATGVTYTVNGTSYNGSTINISHTETKEEGGEEGGDDETAVLNTTKAVRATKSIRAGHLVIEREGRLYDAMGAELK